MMSSWANSPKIIHQLIAQNSSTYNNKWAITNKIKSNKKRGISPHIFFELFYGSNHVPLIGLISQLPHKMSPHLP